MTKNLLWLTDIHLNFLPPHRYDSFFSNIRQSYPDAVVISGDIGEAPTLIHYLKTFEARIQAPIYFVLGNHDFYRGSFRAVTEVVQEACAEPGSRLHWLNDSGVVELSPTTALVGHDSWSDGRLGDYTNSEIMLTDYFLIEEFSGLEKGPRLKLLNELGDAGAAHFRRYLPEALTHYQHVYVVLHPPPFREAVWYNGKLALDDDPYLPHFSCKAVGDALLEITPQYPDKQITVLCGHTHGKGQIQLLDNLLVYTGGAEYKTPVIQEIFQFS